MTSGDKYRIKAAELRAKAHNESDPAVRADLEGLAAAYIRLAEQADRNSLFDVFYEPPLPKADPELKC